MVLQPGSARLELENRMGSPNALRRRRGKAKIGQFQDSAGAVAGPSGALDRPCLRRAERPRISERDSVTIMPHPLPAESQEPERIPERDILAMVAMLDYLIVEVGKIDTMSAQCLMVARKSLTETVGEALVKPN